ncbi:MULTISPECIES: hypothetical protein [Chitinophagaceae]
MKSIFTLVVLFWVPMLWLQAQQYNTISLTPNSRYTKTSDVNATTKMQLYGQDYVYSVSANIKTDYDVIWKDASNYKIKITLDAINSELSSNGVKMSFNSQKDTLDDETDSIFAKPLSDILGETDNVIVDSTGKILQSDTSEIHRKANEYITSTLLLGNDYSIGKKLDIAFDFKDSIKVGTTWSDSLHTEDGFRIDTFRVEKVSNKVISVSMKGQLGRTLQVHQGGNTALAHFVGYSEATLQVAPSTGIIGNRVMHTYIQSQFKVNNVDIPISSDIQLTEVVQ